MGDRILELRRPTLANGLLLCRRLGRARRALGRTDQLVEKLPSAFITLVEKFDRASEASRLATENTRLKCEIWEKWGATYGRNGWVGEKQMTSSRKLATPELCLPPLALTSSAMRWAERCPKWRYGERFEAACKKM